jgi:hypothetical protein
MKHSIALIGMLASAAACTNETRGFAPNGAPSSSGVPSATPTAVLPGPSAGPSGSAAALTAGGVMTAPMSAVSSATSAETTATPASSTSGGGVASASPSASSSGVPAPTSGGGLGDAAVGGGQDAGAEPAPSSMGGIVPSNCVGDAWTSADPTKAGPFQVAADKGVGPLAGFLPDPIYGDEQQRFNVYRPANLATSGYCHPILIWANGYRDNPEQNPPDCIVDSNANRWCGQYSPLLNHLASHGFVVVASLSTATADGDPLPTIAGLDWILEQAEDASSPYYHRLDTANIGQLGHSYGGMSTCMSASEPRYKALATICGTRALSGVHTPMMFFCGGNDTTVDCEGVKNTFATVTDQPAFFINEKNADHGSWVYQGAGGVSLSSAAGWFRAHLMGDTASRDYFYGANCKFCTDNRVEVEQNALMTP